MIGNIENYSDYCFQSEETTKLENYAGGKEKFDTLPALDLSQQSLCSYGWSKFPDNIPMNSLMHPVTRGFNGQDHYDYLIIRYKIDENPSIGMHVFFAGKGSRAHDKGDCAGLQGERDDLSQFIGRIENKTRDDSIKKLIQTGKLECLDFKIELV